jgi:hypothetical protein
MVTICAAVGMGDITHERTDSPAPVTHARDLRFCAPVALPLQGGLRLEMLES